MQLTVVAIAESEEQVACQGISADDVPDFGAHCARLRTELVNFARRFTNGSRDAAEDVVQESLIRASNAWPPVKPEHKDFEQSVRSWLFAIVGNISMNHLRTLKRRREVFNQTVDGSRDSKSSSDAPWDVAATDPRDEHEAETGDEVREAIARLPPYQRVVVEMHYMDGMDLDAIALELKIPKNTVFTRVHRAKIAMRKHLRKYAANAYGIDVDVVAAL